MDKKTILSHFGDEDKNEVINLYEKYILAKEKNITVFGNDFYPPNVWKVFTDYLGEKEFKVDSCGIFHDAERRMIAFNNIYNIEYPMKVIKITNESRFVNLNHRDFLGSILALGIKREKIGDLLVKGNMCYLPVCKDISKFIITNLTSVGKSPCKVSILEDDFDLPTFDFKEFIVLVQSLRIDSIVSKLNNISRSKAQVLIDRGKVLVNYIEPKNKGQEVKAGDRITIRGNGKFILGNVVGNSKSGKFKVKIKKYT